MKQNTLTSGSRFLASALWKAIADVSIFLLFFFCVVQISAQYREKSFAYRNFPERKFPKGFPSYSFEYLGLDTSKLSVTASLLTCGPGDAGYELYGHTALRIRGGNAGEDVVYNYGYFNFKRPNFVWNFILGETDYTLRSIPMSQFYSLYAADGRWVEEQVLNFTPGEAAKLALMLEVNCKRALKDNWTYRYNYLLDNCTTRAIEQIRSALNGKIVLPNVPKTTYRTAIHQYTAGHPWVQLGNDMLLGYSCDRSISADTQMFLPVNAKNLLQSAKIENKDGSLRPLVKTNTRIIDLPDKPADSHWPPIVYVILLLVLTVALTVYEKKKHKNFWGYDVLLLTAQGLAGCLIAFMFFFSKHPTVGSNLLFWWLNPIPLLFLWFVVRDLRRGRPSFFFWVQVLMLTVFFVLAALRIQNFPLETLLLALCLLIRAACHVPRYKAKRKVPYYKI